MDATHGPDRELRPFVPFVALLPGPTPAVERVTPLLRRQAHETG